MLNVLAEILYAADGELVGVADAEPLGIPAHGELGALELGRPRVVELLHDVLAVVPGRHAQGPAGRR